MRYSFILATLSLLGGMAQQAATEDSGPKGEGVFAWDYLPDATESWTIVKIPATLVVDHASVATATATSTTGVQLVQRGVQHANATGVISTPTTVITTTANLKPSTLVAVATPVSSNTINNKNNNNDIIDIKPGHPNAKFNFYDIWQKLDLPEQIKDKYNLQVEGDSKEFEREFAAHLKAKLAGKPGVAPSGKKWRLASDYHRQGGPQKENFVKDLKEHVHPKPSA